MPALSNTTRLSYQSQATQYILIIQYQGRLLPLFKHILKFPSLFDPLGLFQEKIFFLLQRFVFHLRHELGATLPEQQSQAPVVDIRHGALPT